MNNSKRTILIISIVIIGVFLTAGVYIAAKKSNSAANPSILSTFFDKESNLGNSTDNATVKPPKADTSNITVSQLINDKAKYEGKEVSLKLYYDMRNNADISAKIITRSDCYLHDNTGTILLSDGWQIYNEWETSSSKIYENDNLSIDSNCLWTIKKATVNYDNNGLPYLTFTNNGSAVKVPDSYPPKTSLSVGELTSITLDENISTGYSWQYTNENPDIVAFDSEHTIANSTEHNIVGAGSKHVWNFKALKKGESKITFSYYRTWEGPQSAVETHVYNIKVN